MTSDGERGECELNRRNLLRIGAAGALAVPILGGIRVASAATPTASPIPAGLAAARVEPDVDYDCVVIGAGFAGLAAAYRLATKGVRRIRVLESASAPGGICRSETREGYRFPTGTTYTGKPWAGSAAKAVYAHLPRTWWTYIREPFDGFAHQGQILHNRTIFNFEGLPGLTDKQLADCRRLRAWYLRAYDQCEWPIHANKGNGIARYESMSTRALIESVAPGCDPWVLGCLDSFCRGVFNGNLDQISGLQSIDMFGDEFDSYVGGGNDPSEITGRSTYCMSDLVEALVADINRRCRGNVFVTDASVAAVTRPGANRVAVTYRQGGTTASIRARTCIVATNAPAANRLLGGLASPALRSALDSINYGQYATVTLVMANHTVAFDCFDCTLGDDPIDDIYDWTWPRKRREGIPASTPPGLYGGYLAARDSSDQTPMLPPDQLVGLMKAKLDELFGAGTSSHVTDAVVRQLDQGMPIFHPGLTWLQRPVLMPAIGKRIWLAGDYVQGSPTVEGALESGWYAGARARRLL